MSELRPAASDRAALIQRINELSNLARSAWFTLLGYLIFVGITLLSVRDADFFIPSRETQLPLVGVSIPTASFFWTAPVLGAALYTYLHLFLIKLWDAHAEARTSDAEPTHHWLVNDFVLIRQGDKVARARPMAWLVVVITFGLVWAAGPLVLAYAWFRSLPAHEEWLTLLIAACLALSIYVGSASWSRERAGSSKPPIASLTFWRSSGLIGAFLLLIASWDLTEGGVLHLYRANLREVAFVELPPGWQSHDAAARAYRETWCRQEGLNMNVCGQALTADNALTPSVMVARSQWCKTYQLVLSESCANYFEQVDKKFGSDWHGERAKMLASLAAADLSGADLRGAHLERTILTGVRLKGARLTGANLSEAQAEGADFSKSFIKRASFALAIAHGANFSLSQIKETNFSRADLKEADFFSAKLTRVWFAFSDLSKANFSYSDVRFADFYGAVLWRGDLFPSKIDFINFSDSDLRGVVGLNTHKLKTSIGNPNTILPKLHGAYILSCYPEISDDVHIIIGLQYVEFIPEYILEGPPAETSYQNRRFRMICAASAPHKTGVVLSSRDQRPSGHPIDVKKMDIMPFSVPE